MRERLNLRTGRGSQPPPRYAPRPTRQSQLRASNDSIASNGYAEDFSSSTLPGARDGAYQAETDDRFDNQRGYADRIMSLAKKTVRRLFRYDGESDDAAARSVDAEKGDRLSGRYALPNATQTPLNAPFAPPPPPLPVSAASTEMLTQRGLGNHGGHPYAAHHATLGNSQAQLPAGGDVYLQEPREAHGPSFSRSAPTLTRGADTVLSSAAPNVTVYQFFNAPTHSELQGTAPPTWYDRNTYSFSAPHPARAVADVRPTIQYKRSRAQDEEMQHLQAPPLHRRERAGATSTTTSVPVPSRELQPVMAPSAATGSAKENAAELQGSKPTFGAPVSLTAEKSKPATPAPASSNPFFKPAPPTVTSEDHGFARDSKFDASAPTGGLSKENGEAKASPFSFGGPKTGVTAAVPSAPAPPQPKGTMASPFSFGGGTGSFASSTTAGASAPGLSFGSATTSKPSTAAPMSFGSGTAAPSSGNANPFFKAGPPAVIPDDDGFATDSDSEVGNTGDKDGQANEGPKETTATKPVFSFGSANSGAAPFPSFGASKSTAAPFAPAPGSFSATATTASASAVPGPAAAPPVMGFGSFRKPGPPAVIPSDDGFASDADDSDKEDASDKPTQKARTEETSTAPKAMFSFGLGGSSNSASAAPPPNPFSFGSAAPGNSGGGNTAPTFSFFQKP